jgi:hypothetical protein
VVVALRRKRWVRPPPDYAERWGNKRSDYGASPYARDEAATAAVKAGMAALIGPFEQDVYPHGNDAEIIEEEDRHGRQGEGQRRG